MTNKKKSDIVQDKVKQQVTNDEIINVEQEDQIASTTNQDDVTTQVVTTSDKPGSSIVPALASLPEKLASISNFEELPYPVKIDILATFAKDAKTGLKSPANAVMIYEKSRELKVGFANAVSHMHFIKDKLGIDIHIIKAILGRPGSGISWVKTEDYAPVYSYIDETGYIYENDLLLPKDAVIVRKFPSDKDKYYVCYLPTIVNNKPQVLPTDFRTTYEFTRKKKDIDGSWITIKEIGRFTWKEAILAKLPNPSGQYDENSNWQKYRKLMLSIRAFTFGAREIASDLLLGAYETTELFDMTGTRYDAKDYVKDM